MATVECKVRVRYSEVGRQGFAHHATYFNWFDMALEELIKVCGISYKDIEDLGFLFAPVVDQCKYIHPAKYNDILTIRLMVSDISSVTVKFSYEIFRERDAVLIASGKTTHVFVDAAFRPHSIKRVVPRLYATISDMVTQAE